MGIAAQQQPTGGTSNPGTSGTTGKNAQQAAPPGGKTAASATPGTSGKGAAQGSYGSQTGGGGVPNIASLLGPLLGSMMTGGQMPTAGGQQGAANNGITPVQGGGAMGYGNDMRQALPQLGGQGAQAGYPSFAPFNGAAASQQAQGFWGNSSAQQNPNQGGASTAPSTLTSPGMNTTPNTGMFPGSQDR